MSDVMLYGVLRMPFDLAMSDDISRLHFYQLAQEAVDRLELAEAATEAAKATGTAGELFGYGSSEKKNCLLSKAQYDNCAPKNRTAYDIPLYAYSLPKCENCKGYGVITHISGQTPDNYEECNEVCPDCEGELAARQPAPVAPALTVWEGAMPESNGKSNFTAVLHRNGAKGFDVFEDGFTIARSEYPGRVRYEADCVRYLIGELTERPCIINYDADTHSGYVDPARAALAATAAPVAMKDHEIAQVVNKLRDIAIEFHSAQQLRERIAHVIVPILSRSQQ